MSFHRQQIDHNQQQFFNKTQQSSDFKCFRHFGISRLHNFGKQIDEQTGHQTNAQKRKNQNPNQWRIAVYVGRVRARSCIAARQGY